VRIDCSVSLRRRTRLAEEKRDVLLAASTHL
jgi:hypothetical protein